MIIHCGKLTTCNALEDGESVKLNLADTAGNPVSLLLAFEQAESIAMTLPRLLCDAVKMRTCQDNARYVFPLGQWLLEGGEDHNAFILTLRTVDGFAVSFKIPSDTCLALGSTLQHEADDAIAAGAGVAPSAAAATTEFH